MDNRTLIERINAIAEAIINSCNSDDLEWLVDNSFLHDGSMHERFNNNMSFILSAPDFMESMERMMEARGYAHNTYLTLADELDNTISHLLKPHTEGILLTDYMKED